MLAISKFRKVTGIAITTNHNDKMEGLASISTSPLCNPLCAKRSKNEKMICSKCYSETMNKRFANLRNMLIKNTEVLTARILSDKEIPFLVSETMYFRFEAFGDLVNEIQVVNYFKMAAMNPQIKCALWTKNPWFIDKAIKEYNLVKPGNLTIIGSSYYMNQSMNKFYNSYDFIDYTFTVYSKEYSEEHNINITCGGRKCAECGKCYTRSHKTNEIAELLK